MRRVVAIAALAAAVLPSLGWGAGDVAGENKRCIDLAAAHQVVAGSRNVRLYPDQALTQLRADRSFHFSEGQSKEIVNAVYFGAASQISQPMAIYKAVYEDCMRGPDPRWAPLK